MHSHQTAQIHLGYLKVHMLLVELMWFIIPNLSMHPSLFLCKGKSFYKRTGSPRGAARKRCLAECIPHFSKWKKKNFQGAIPMLLCEMISGIKVDLIYICGSTVSNNTKSSCVKVLWWLYLSVGIGGCCVWLYKLISNDAHQKRSGRPEHRRSWTVVSGWRSIYKGLM